MKLFKHPKRIIIALSLTVLVLLGLSFTRFQTLQQVILFGMLNNHFRPLAIDDTFSEAVFDEFIESMDPKKRFFTQGDIAILSRYKYSIDDQIKKNEFNFFQDVQKVYNKRVDEIQNFYPELFDSPYIFASDEEIEIDSDKRDFQRSPSELEALWRKMVEHQVLSEYIYLKQKEVTGDEKITTIFDVDLEEKAREQVKEDLDISFERLTEESFEERLEIYFNSLSEIFDVHSNYFPAEKKEDFDINISGKLEGIGAMLREDDGFIKVVSIVPGSASWKQGHLKAEDVILEVAQGNEEPVDIVGARVREAVRLIRGKKGTEVRLTVRHVSGEEEVIPIVRDVVVIEETYAKHALVDDKRSGKRFGYIQLPKFYRDFTNAKARNTTDDIRKALDDLIAKDVEGIVLDLRNNSGGALVDAVDSAGLFFDEGPVVQIRSKSTYNDILKDTDKATVYDGPLVVLVNSYSASASEILAAALQDYGRAVIVGSDTFGKGTVQTFIDLDRFFIKNKSKFDALGSIKVTVQKFYRISGQSTQHKGVSPDIYLPSLADPLEVGERFADHALPWDTIAKLDYFMWAYEPIDMKRLAKASEKRVNALPRYQLMRKHIDYIQSQTEDTSLPLNIEKAVAERLETKATSDAYDDSIVAFEDISYTSPDDDDLSLAQKESYKEWIKKLPKDVHLYESFAILNDLSEDKVFKKP